MPSLNDLSNRTIALDRRIALALEFAIGALNDAPSFGTHILDPENGRPLSSYRVLAKLDPVLAEARVVFADVRVEGDDATETHPQTSAPDQQAAAAAEAMLIFYDALKGQQPSQITQSPASVISDLITDLMRYARREGIEFSDALAISYSRIAGERPEHLAPDAG